MNEEVRQQLSEKMSGLEPGTKEYFLAAKALSELTKADAEIKKAEAEKAKVDAEAWRCESNESIAKTEAKAEVIRSVIDGGVKVMCGVLAAKVTEVGYRLITEHEAIGVCTSAVKGFIPKLKFW